MSRRLGARLLALRWVLSGFLFVGCASPAFTVTPPGPGVPRITAFEIVPGRIESGCAVTFRIDFEDTGADATRALMRWRVRINARRSHESSEMVAVRTEELAGRTVGHAEVVVVPPHAGAWIYRVQLEDAQGQTSNVGEARVDVTLLPFWRRARCDSPASAPSQSLNQD